ncbi:MAG: RNA methyltransferase [Desulfuromonadaceae bacterium]|nr:RNA methyltransferase [Desulfuromonadaceae bacterium]
MSEDNRTDWLSSTAVVLVEPQGPLNIGAVGRAMANFGFHDLRLVNPQTDHLCDEARRMAVKAGSILEQARIYPDLSTALADTSYAFATTRRFGRYREDFVHPAQVEEVLSELDTSAPAALVFGREDCGLLTEELDLCQRFITIPTSDELASMNLAQAVCLCLYELAGARARNVGKAPGERSLASSTTTEAMFAHMRTSLTHAGYLVESNPDHILRSFRRIFGKNGLTERDVRILRGLWRRIDWLSAQLDTAGHKSDNCGRDSDV